MIVELRTVRLTCDACGVQTTVQVSSVWQAINAAAWTRRTVYCDDASCHGHEEHICPACAGKDDDAVATVARTEGVVSRNGGTA